jgi:peptide/nickel transport system substrate-binding protein
MIYDTLFGTDEHGKIKPQMVESWTESPDKRLWTFSLRKGLEFHDGRRVTGEDVIASLRRWGMRDTMGAALMQFVTHMDAPQAESFRIFLNEPNGFMLEALGKPSSNVPFIMPRTVAQTDAFKQIDDFVGSGPYIFKRDEFRPGDKAVYIRNARYIPRSEAPSGTTGGKRVYVDRVEWNLALRDPQAQVNALKQGEVDVIESLPSEHYESVKADPALQLRMVSPHGWQLFARFNHLHKPFDHPKVRRAAIAALAQEPFLQVQVGVRALYKSCHSMFICGTPYGSTAGSEIQTDSTMKKAQALLKASAYDGTPVVILKPTDVASIRKLPDVAAQLLRQAGFKVDVQAMDFQTMVARIARKAAPDKGGWNLYLASIQAYDVWNPVGNVAMDTRGEKSPRSGWALDEEMQVIRDEFMRSTDEGKRKKLAAGLHARAFEVGTSAPLGEFHVPMAARKNITGFFASNVAVYWNLKKS